MGKGLLVVVILIILTIAGLFLYTRFAFLAEPEPEINMQQKIKDEVSCTPSIVIYDWNVWSRTFRDSGGILTKMDTWEQFKESYRQSIKPITIKIDEGHCVVWFRGAINHAMYYEY